MEYKFLIHYRNELLYIQERIGRDNNTHSHKLFDSNIKRAISALKMLLDVK